MYDAASHLIHKISIEHDRRPGERKKKEEEEEEEEEEEDGGGRGRRKKKSARGIFSRIKM